MGTSLLLTDTSMLSQWSLLLPHSLPLPPNQKQPTPLFPIPQCAGTKKKTKLLRPPAAPAIESICAMAHGCHHDWLFTCSYLCEITYLKKDQQQQQYHNKPLSTKGIRDISTNQTKEFPIHFFRPCAEAYFVMNARLFISFLSFLVLNNNEPSKSPLIPTACQKCFNIRLGECSLTYSSAFFIRSVDQ